MQALPLSLYIHIPWCIKKCPYCDFNSHALKGELPENLYVANLLADLDENLHYCQGRPLRSIFLGGGTPSLFSAQALEKLFLGIHSRLACHPDIEITLEANPGTFEQARFRDYRALGINRLSIGIQSLNNEQLKNLGRIHDRDAAIRAVKTAQDSGFENINVDLMYGLPQQVTASALQDLEEALTLKTPHLSWYQLTLEPQTEFYYAPPPLPADDDLWEMQEQGQILLRENGLLQYEVSAYSLPDKLCAHNLNYWQFGDYLGIGAGAHSKITFPCGKISRHSQVKNPRDYLHPTKAKTAHYTELSSDDLIFEFMLNGLRLVDGISLDLFAARTGLSPSVLAPLLNSGAQQQLLVQEGSILKPSELGRRFLNDLTALFLKS